MEQLRPRAKRSDVKFGQVFVGELARSFARGITVIAGALLLEIVHRLFS